MVTRRVQRGTFPATSLYERIRAALSLPASTGARLYPQKQPPQQACSSQVSESSDQSRSSMEKTVPAAYPGDKSSDSEEQRLQALREKAGGETVFIPGSLQDAPFWRKAISETDWLKSKRVRRPCGWRSESEMSAFRQKRTNYRKSDRTSWRGNLRRSLDQHYSNTTKR